MALMMENPVKSPMVPPTRLSWASNLIFLSFWMLSKVAVSKKMCTRWSSASSSSPEMIYLICLWNILIINSQIHRTEKILHQSWIWNVEHEFSWRLCTQKWVSVDPHCPGHQDFCLSIFLLAPSLATKQRQHIFLHKSHCSWKFGHNSFQCNLCPLGYTPCIPAKITVWM